VTDGVLRVRVAAPPVEGAANQALLRVIAGALDVPRRDVRLVAGAGGRSKLIAVDGVTPERVLETWPDLRL
jgi:uncharacterized protein YggU (UPF0235/DUF167 family)